MEANAGMLFGGMKLKYSDEGESVDVSYLTLGLFVKYPINLDSLNLFPMLGIKLDNGLSMKYDGENVYGNSSERADFMNRFRIKFGLGANFNIADKLYLRPSFLYGFNFGSKDDRELKN